MPVAIPAPAATPVPQPTASPVPEPTSTPQPTVTLDFSDPSVIAAYHAARTPQVSITVAATPSTSGTSSASPGKTAAGQPDAGTIQPIVQDGVGTLVRLPSPASITKPKTSSTSAATTPSANAQPVSSVLLTYNPAYTGRLVWVQMLGAGTLTTSDNDGHVYDGSSGFYLTLNTTGAATFDYQAPNVSGTYQVLTRFSNVTTTLPFLVPDDAP